MKQQPSRRRFLKTGCLTAAGVGVALCGGGALVTTYQPPIDFPASTTGDTAMTNRTLITYASKAGSTAEVAAKMGETLTKKGVAVDVLPINKIGDLAQYQAVILGSAIRMGKVLPEAQTFVAKNQAVLQQKPFSAFVVCMTMHNDTEENRKTAGAYLDPIRALVKPLHEGLFAGAVDLSRLSLLDRLISNMVKTPVGDFRSWPQITTWAEGLAG